MPRVPKHQREADAIALKEAAEKKARRAPIDGLSPDRGRGGSPTYTDKPGHHWELVRYGGQRQYVDSDLIHVDPFKEPGFQEFHCRLQPESDPEIEVIHALPKPLTPGPSSSTTNQSLPALDAGVIHPAFGDGNINTRVVAEPAISTSTSSKVSLRTNSPAPRPLPPFEEYLEFCSINKNDGKTRALLHELDIIDFEMFFSPELSVEAMRSLGFGFGPRLRLHAKATVYRDDLKKRQRK